jgi:hypothetical protein
MREILEKGKGVFKESGGSAQATLISSDAMMSCPCFRAKKLVTKPKRHTGNPGPVDQHQHGRSRKKSQATPESSPPPPRSHLRDRYGTPLPGSQKIPSVTKSLPIFSGDPATLSLFPPHLTQPNPPDHRLCLHSDSRDHPFSLQLDSCAPYFDAYT